MDNGMRPYLRLGIALAISYVVMFAVMFSRVHDAGHLYGGLNQVYMAGLMVAHMMLIMLLIMAPMFKNRRLNIGLAAGGAGAAVLCLVLLRMQAGVGDDQFLRSMIPHHSAAILVCERSEITDPEIKRLCEQIVESQRREIEQMKEIMRRRQP